ncbi:pseudouridine synthase [Roseibacillus persicicus]|nr:16S rRNA pseudouridine(516) synthase [Roseibacillus persicicus]
MSDNSAVRLDRMVGKWGQWGRREVRERLSRGMVRVNGVVCPEGAFQVGPFDRVECGSEVLQARVARSLMLHKPLGVVSATSDLEHRTVVDLIGEPWATELHLAGRLDRFTSGLLILSNDSSLTEALTEPGRKLGKRYRVTCDGDVTPEIVVAFEKGIWFAKEQVATQPAQVELLSGRQCLLTIYEGKHHQVKRMFARFDVKVTALHRETMGPLSLDPALQPGEWRMLTADELQLCSFHRAEKA